MQTAGFNRTSSVDSVDLDVDTGTACALKMNLLSAYSTKNCISL